MVNFQLVQIQVKFVFNEGDEIDELFLVHIAIFQLVYIQIKFL